MKLIASISLFFLIFGMACGSSSGTTYGSNSNTGTSTPTTSSFTVSGENAPIAYTINGVANPTLTLQRGQTYTFAITTIGHPFYIMTVQGTNTANAFSIGVAGNGTQNGTLTFTVPMNAPNTLYYDCSIHPSMSGVINIVN